MQAPKSNLVTFFSDAEDGRKLVGIGLTDQFLKELVLKGAALQEAERTGKNVDVIVVYAPELNELVKKIKALSSEGNTEVTVI